MNTGSKLILFLGITAAILFGISTVNSVISHQRVREYHLERLNTLKQLAEQNKMIWKDVRNSLEQNKYAVSESGSAWLVTWENPAEQKTLQSARLGIPRSVQIELDSTGVSILRMVEIQD